jgi:hypothetical protein
MIGDLDLRVNASDAAACRGEPWGLRLWVTLAAVVLIAGGLQSYGIATWPMADDEVPSLVEMGMLHVDGQAFSVPAAQITKLPKALPVWYGIQRRLLALLPRNELGFRIPSLICGILTSALGFLLAARWRGLTFAISVAIVQNASLPFIYLAQIDRFYSMTLLLEVLTFAAICLPHGGVSMLLATALLAGLTVLSHNITAAVFVLALFAAAAAYMLDRLPARVVARTGVAAAVGVSLYLFYLRPIVQGWNGTGNPTPVLVSFTAHAGVPALALALFGCWLAIVRPGDDRSMIWWALLFVGSLCFFQVFGLTSISLSPHYFLFFLPAMWLVAAHAVDAVARGAGARAAVGWYGAVALVFAPSLVSHFQDGSRHDYRQAAAALQSHAAAGQTILSDDAETISYYLPPNLRERLYVRTKVTALPASEFFLVCRMNAWMPLPDVPGRRMELLAEIGRRRYDQFSHILRIYRVAAANPTLARVVPTVDDGNDAQPAGR